MAGIAAHRVAAMSFLLDAVETDLGVLKRRLAKSGAKHFAVARFDALDHICQTCFRELESESTAVNSVVDEVLFRVYVVAQELDSLADNFEELSDWAARPKRTRERTQRLISEIKGGAGFSLDRSAVKYKRELSEESTRGVLLQPGQQLDSKMHAGEPSEDAPLALSGVFARKRRAR